MLKRAPSSGYRNAKAPALPDGRRCERCREAQPNVQGALKDAPTGVQRCAMPPTQMQTGAPKLVKGSQAQTGAPRSAKGTQEPQGALLPQVGSPSPDDAKQPQVDAPFPDGAEYLLDARPSSDAPYPRDTPRLAARQPCAPKQHASEAPPFAAPQFGVYCCYRCPSCAHYTTRQAAPPLANEKKQHVVEKMPPNSIGWK